MIFTLSDKSVSFKLYTKDVHRLQNGKSVKRNYSVGDTGLSLIIKPYPENVLKLYLTNFFFFFFIDHTRLNKLEQYTFLSEKLDSLDIVIEVIQDPEAEQVIQKT